MSHCDPYSETTTFAYDIASRLTQKTFASGAYDVTGYDSRNRITSVTHKNSSGTVLSSETYSLDSASNLSSKTVDSLTTSYTYDAANQILSESNIGYSASYSYDANSNRSSQVLNGTTYSYSYDSGDKLTSVSSGGSTVKSYGYDGAGRTHTVTTSAGTTTLSYDYEDRVTGITYPSSATNSFTYNGLDTRVGKVDSSGTSTYKRDGADVTDPVLSDGSIAYTPGTSERKSGASTFDHANYLGTFNRQTNSSQATTATRVYDAFGNLELSTGTPQSSFGFVGARGYQEDGNSGLKLLGHRYYDSSSARFLTRDHARDGRNWYVYSRSRPNNLVDPNGMNIIGEFFEAVFEAYDDWSGTDGYDHDGHPIRVGGWTSKFIPDGTAQTYGGTVHLPDVPTAGQFNRPERFHWRDHEEGHIVQQGNMPSPIYVGVYGILAVVCGVDELTNPGVPPSRWGPPGHDHNPMETLAEDYAWDKEGNSGNEGTWGR